MIHYPSWCRHFAMSLLLALLLTLHTSALVDTNQNGFSDLWERTYHAGDLLPSDFDPQADPDGDGWTNAREAAAGTDPFNGTPPNGFINVAITRVPAVYGTPPEGGDPEIVTPEAFVTGWPVTPGKRYILLCSPDLSAGSWFQVGVPIIESVAGHVVEVAVTPTQVGGGSPEKCFWRVAIDDVDSDGDGLIDAEEYQLGTNPNNRDTDGDGVSDWDEVVVNGTNPLSPVDIISNGNGIPDDLEKHLAKQFLAYQPDPAAWGAYYTDLALGQLDATHDYTGDGISAGSLANLLRSAPVTLSLIHI